MPERSCRSRTVPHVHPVRSFCIGGCLAHRWSFAFCLLVVTHRLLTVLDLATALGLSQLLYCTFCISATSVRRSYPDMASYTDRSQVRSLLPHRSLLPSESTHAKLRAFFTLTAGTPPHRFPPSAFCRFPSFESCLLPYAVSPPSPTIPIVRPIDYGVPKGPCPYRHRSLRRGDGPSQAAARSASPGQHQFAAFNLPAISPGIVRIRDISAPTIPSTLPAETAAEPANRSAHQPTASPRGATTLQHHESCLEQL